MSNSVDFFIRLCLEQDKDVITELAAEYEFSTYQVDDTRPISPSEDPTGWTTARNVASSMLQNCEIYVAVEDNSIVGFVAGDVDDGLRYGHLYILYVRRDFRHRGIGA